jgi:hypothetical protein
MEERRQWVETDAIGIFIVGGILLGCFFPMLTGYITMGAAPLISAIIVASAVVFIILMVVEIRCGNMFGAVVNGVFGVLLGLAPGMLFLTEFIAQGMGIEVDARVVGWYFMYIAPVLLVVGFVGGYMFWHFAIAFWVLAADVFLLGMVFAGYLSHTWNPTLGWVIGVGGIYFFYMATASFLNGMMHRKVLPLGGGLFKAGGH